MECARSPEVETVLRLWKASVFLSAVHSPHAGASVIHCEMPEKGFACAGERMHGLQLWVNLAKRDKMRKPRYQEIPKLVNS